MWTIRAFKIFALVAALFALYGCLPPDLRVRKFGPDFSSPGADEALIFGRVMLSEKGVSTLPYAPGNGPLLFFMHVESELTSEGVRVAGDGTFAVVVPRGTYLLKFVDYGYSMKPQVVFQAEGAGPYYIGDLSLDADIRGDLAVGTLFARSVRVEVEDMSGETARIFKEQHPWYANAVTKRLMRHDTAITPDVNLYNRARLSTLLERLGMPLIKKYIPREGRGNR